jgi:arginase
MTALQVITVPFDAGVVGERMGAGPDALVAAGLLDRLRLRHDVDAIRVVPAERWRAELRTTFTLHHDVAEQVRRALVARRAPLVLAGDCNMTVAAAAGLGTDRRTGVVWIDAHGDFNTPDTDPDGYLDGQGLSMLTGRCWTAHTRSLTGFTPILDHRVLLVAARDLDDEESLALDGSDIGALSAQECQSPDTRGTALARLIADVDRVHVHFDADALDPEIAPANSYAASEGLQPDEVIALITELSALRPVVSATIASWDPSFDREARLGRALTEVIEAIALVIDHS